ncbi:MAG TPA: hypothetical protein VGB87_15945 [Vicinamibacteria bacterium]
MSADADPRELLRMAGGLLRRGDPATAGLWPRASALLALEALETGLSRLWEDRRIDLRGCSMRTQLICLRSYLEDARLAARAGHAWSALSRACHHHAYELAPTSGELESWFGVVGELVEQVEGR